jgi:O-methyltransferase domain
MERRLLIVLSRVGRRKTSATPAGARGRISDGGQFAAIGPGCPRHDRSLSFLTRRCARTCRKAMRPGSRLLLVEAILPERARDCPAAIRMDLHMLLLLGARERTEAEFRRLLARTGFHVQRVVRTRSPAGLGVIEATPG